MAGLNLDAAASAASASDNANPATSTPPADTGAISQPQASSTPPSAGASTSDASPASGAAPAAGTTTPSWSLRDQLHGLGIDPAQFQDDATAWQHLQNQLAIRSQEFQRQQQLLQWQNQQLQMMQRQQQAPAAPPAQPQAPGWWNPPEYSAMWEQPFMQDKDGRAVTPADVDNSIAAKLNAFRQWQRGQFQSFMQDPIKTLEPGLKEFVAPLVQQAIQQHLGQYQDRQFANQYVEQQRQQLFQHDAQGNRLYDMYNQPVLSPIGQRFVQIVQQLDQAGIKSPQMQQQIASNMIELERLRSGAAQSGAVGAPPVNETVEQRNDRLKREALARGAGAARLPSSGGAPPPSATTPEGGNRGIDVRLSLGDKLNRALSKNGAPV